MKGIKRFLTILSTALALSSAADAREAVPIINHIDIPVVTTTGKPLTAEHVKAAITAAAIARNWAVTKSPNQDLLSATLHVRGKHTVVVSIPYSPDKYSLKYESSVNMKYAPGANGDVPTANESAGRGISSSASGPLIHPFYNRWVQDLMHHIRLEMIKL